MINPLINDELRGLVGPLLPPAAPKPESGRPRISDRTALTSIIFVLKIGISPEMLPPEMSCRPGATCWR